MIHLLFVDSELVARFSHAPDDLFNASEGKATKTLYNTETSGVVPLYQRLRFHGLYLEGSHATHALRASGVCIPEHVQEEATNIGQTFVYFEERRSDCRTDVMDGC